MSKFGMKGSLLASTVLAGIAVATPAFAQDATNTPPTPASPATQSTSPTETTGAPTPGEPTGAVQNANRGSANEEIVVTGTLLRRTNTETPSPVTVLSAETLDDRGINTVSQAVTQLTSNNAGTIPQGWNNGSNFATGATGVSLRGLTVQDTLVIFDGLRQAFYPLSDDGRRNFVDLNTVPDAVVDRIEVLRDGASSTYGSDAIAGVVNVITKKEIRGVHLNASHGWTQHGGGAENRIDATVGFGDLANHGVNVYLSGEYQSTNKIWARQRGFPFNTGDLSGICNHNGTNCGFNGNLNGLSLDDSFNGLFGTVSPLIRPYTNPGAAGNPAALGPYQLADGACTAGETPVSVPAGLGAALPAGTTVCELDSIKLYQQNQPDQKRIGLFSRATVRIGDRAEGFLQANYYQVKTRTSFLPVGLTDRTTSSGFAVTSPREAFNPFFLPVYICPVGTPYIVTNPADPLNAVNQTRFNCSATTPGAQLNPFNPFADPNGDGDGADGQIARVVARYDRPRVVKSDSRSYRVAGGVNGDFGDDANPFHYNVSATYSRIDLTLRQFNYLNVRNMIIAANAGLYDFLNPDNNTEEQRDFIAPPNTTNSNATNFEVDGVISHDLFQLPGGAFGAAVGLQYRRETLNNPSANPPNFADPYNRLAGANAVAAFGQRNVKSAYFELDAPFMSLANNGIGLEANLSGRYDKYSSGQKNFSPKLGVKFTPVREIALRGTYSKGFRVPSFNEAFGLPTTGFVTQSIDCASPIYAAFCAQHAPGYINGASLGLTASGNPNLKPEKSRSFTLGTVFEPTRQLSFTVDYWDIKIKNLISDDPGTTAALQAYYLTGNPNAVPGVTVIPGLPDPLAAPDALPLAAEVAYQFVNANSQRAKGIDFGATGRFNIRGVRWTSSLEASYLMSYVKKIPGGEESYAGLMSPCNITSCSGAPRWKGTWQNTLDFGRFKTTLTSYYTSSIDDASTDAPYAGTRGDCEANIGAGIGQSAYGGTAGLPLQCRSPKVIYHNLTGSFDLTDKITLYGNIINLFDKKPPVDISAAYGIFNYNPAWAQDLFIGRFFRLGAKLDLEGRTEAPAPYVAPAAPPPPATTTCPDGTVVAAGAACPQPPAPPPPPAPSGERGR